MQDSYGRCIDYMRVSITDRCNLRCQYCVPNDIVRDETDELLTFEEIEEVCHAAAAVGIRKIKVTGGEPLVRPGCAQLVGKLKRISGIEQVTLTTNGILLKHHLPELLESGIDAVNVSLNSLNQEQYMQVTGKDGLSDVLEGIRRAVSLRIPVKINSVLLPGINENEWEQLADLARQYSVDVRFIEMMPIGNGKKYTAIDNNMLLMKLREKYPLIQSDPQRHGNGPAVYYHIPDFQGSIGFISAVHGRFCGTCNRIRLTAHGQCKPCLCYDNSVDLRQVLRDKQDRMQEQRELLLQNSIKQAISMKPSEHCFDALAKITETKQMVQIGG